MSEGPAAKGMRTQQHEIVIDAPLEAVWKAISEGEELTRWFVEEATVEPGVGGTITISWGGDEKAQGRIDAWEPNRKLRKTLMPFEMGPAKYDGTTPMVDEYTIERRDGKTVLRLVNSGIPNAPEWDGFYNGTEQLDGTPSSARCATISNITAAGRARRSRSSGRCPVRPRTHGRVSWLRSSRRAPSSSNKRRRLSR